jgi:hypothetical protein
MMNVEITEDRNEGFEVFVASGAKGTLKIEGVVFNKLWWITVDTGSAVTLINQDFLNALPEQIRSTKRAIVGETLSAANGQTLEVEGVYDFVLALQQKHFKVTARCVPLLACAFLLGNDFLEHNGVVVDYSRAELRIQGLTVPSIIGGRADEAALLKMESTVEVPPRSEMLVYAKPETLRS